MAAAPTREFFTPERLLAFSDGVSAVVVTLLVIDLRLPAIAPEADDQALVKALAGMAPNLLLFVFSFLVVGMSWLGHHRKFSYIAKIDNGVLWLNLLYLMSLCLVPFGTSILGEHGSRVGFILYVVVMAMASLTSAGLSVYALRAPFLAAPGLSAGVRRDMTLSPLLTGIAFLVAAALAFGNWTRISHWSLLAIVPITALFGFRRREAATPGPGARQPE
jgi:uncharacterized membrane protein